LLGVTVVDSLWWELELSTVPALFESVELLDRSLEVLLVVVVGGGTGFTGGACTITWVGGLGT
jgi:hypothetical protein